MVIGPVSNSFRVFYDRKKRSETWSLFKRREWRHVVIRELELVLVNTVVLRTNETP